MLHEEMCAGTTIRIGLIVPALAIAALGAGPDRAVGPALTVVYPSTPDWISSNPHYSTGAALADVDRDGRLDIVIADGNDIQRGRLNVYYNQGGWFNQTADWQSADLAYNGHLDVADVNGDGWVDVAVAHLGRSGVVAPVAKLYLNNGGTLSSTPDWEAHVDGNAFGVDFGDVDNDGRPDLAVGTGWAYGPTPYYNYVYRNVDGGLEATASWTSGDRDLCQGVLWADADDDGWLDLVAIGSDDETKIYRNVGGDLESLAGWSTTDSGSQDGLMLTCGDVNGDGYRDLFATDNDQLGGSGRFKQYLGLPGGFFEDAHSWSYFDGYGSAIALADVNGDGRLDLATGAWWDHTRLFFNDGAGLPNTPSWSSGVTSVVEKIVFGDVDPPCGVERFVVEQLPPDLHDGHLFHLSRQQIQEIRWVRRDGVVLASDEYTYSREHGWLTIGAPAAASLSVAYTDSTSRDMVVSNWDGDVGNFLYYSLVIDDCNENGTADGCDIASGESDDANGNGIPDECECLGDVDGSGGVDFADVLLILSAWGPCSGCPADADGSGTVDFGDILIVLAGWGACG